MDFNDLKTAFPCTYKTKSGQLIHITGLAFIGTPEGTQVNLAWDLNGDLLKIDTIFIQDKKNISLVELVKGPGIAPNGPGRRGKVT